MILRAVMSRQFLVGAFALALGACGALVRPEPAQRPFLSYTLTIRDLDLRLLHVKGILHAAGLRGVPIGAIPSEGGAGCDPIGLAAVDLRGRKLPVRRDGHGWIVENHGIDFTFGYDVALRLADRTSPDVRSMMTFLGNDRCRLLTRDVLLVPEIAVADGILIDLLMPAGWRLEASSQTVRRRMVVPDLDELSSAMAVSGAYRSLSRVVAGAEIILTIADSWTFGDEEFFNVVCRIVAHEIALFGAPERSRYLFVLDGNPVRGGERFDYYGLHYGGSIVLLLDRRLDRSELMDAPMSIIAHEFFHNWNGEALKPVSDRFLWFTEGVTTYYSYRVLLDSNIITRGQYEIRIGMIAKRYRENPLTRTVPVAASGNSDMSDKDMVSLLYDGAFLAAKALDERLHAETGGRIDLIDVLREMYGNAHGKGTIDEGLLVDAVRKLSGSDLAPFLNTLAHTPAPCVLVAPPCDLN